MDVSQPLRDVLSDRYRIEREIGAGGMATVYLAEDLKHRRRVALKVLRPELGAVLGPERFLSEINVTANLQHPHLLPLFDSGEAEGLLFYVMPYIEGESLRHRLERERQLPVDEAVRMAVAIASALDYAHRHGVIHRDLKPENILLHDGQPLVADFGIALAVSNAGGARVTQTGLSLGTPQYMSPEQATGDRVIDARSDIYSLAAMLYEMLVGEPPHSAPTTQGIIAKLLTEPPPSARTYRNSVAEHVDEAIQCALAKLAADRFATAAEFAAALGGAHGVTRRAQAHPGAERAGPSGRRSRLTPALIAAAGLFGGAALTAGIMRTAGEGPRVPLLTGIEMGDSAAFRSFTGPSVALSRQGTHLAFTGSFGSATGVLLRAADSRDVQFVRGTESATTPVFSPDGGWLAFIRDGELYKVPLGGGTAVLLTDSAGPPTDWAEDGYIYHLAAGGIARTPQDGGVPELVVPTDTAAGHVTLRWLEVLPGGRYALVTVFKGGADIGYAQLGVARLRDGRVTELGMAGSNPRYVNTGHVAFAREDGSIYAAPFSLRRRRITGPLVRIAETVNTGGGGKADIAFSENGMFVYGTGVAVGRHLYAVTPTGSERQLTREIGEYVGPRVSPDGRRISLGLRKEGWDIWVLEAASGTLTRLTSGEDKFGSAWTPDGRSVAYINTTADSVVQSKFWDGSGQATLVTRTKPVSEIGYSAANRLLVLRTSALSGNRDILVMPWDSPGSIQPFLATAADERSPEFSADGKLVAYASDETGEHEIYVRPYPGPGARVRVSQQGGVEPLWSRDGRELYYRGPSHMMAATITRTPELAVVSERRLFPDAYARQTARGYDVLPSGEFVMVDRGRGAGAVQVVVNWAERLRSARTR